LLWKTLAKLNNAGSNSPLFHLPATGVKHLLDSVCFHASSGNQREGCAMLPSHTLALPGAQENSL
jgi:hypothetical protein